MHSPLQSKKNPTYRHFEILSISFTPHLPASFGRDTKSRWSLLFGVKARGSKRPHTGGKCVTCSGLTNSRWTLNALQRSSPVSERSEARRNVDVQLIKFRMLLINRLTYQGYIIIRYMSPCCISLTKPFPMPLLCSEISAVNQLHWGWAYT